LNAMRPHPLLDGIAVGAKGLHAYFVHSFELKPAARNDLVAQAEYGGPLTAIVGRDTVVGTQFHPEKSQRLGLTLIANFPKWSPRSFFRRSISTSGCGENRATWRARPCSTRSRPRKRRRSPPRASAICTSSISTARLPASR